ncbi:type IV pilin protein [Kangiella aquimarina]|uniref:Type IV pilin protein n=1 Tax=Kangiella aquimarina TaxID=261965 RepID=A0ABZ0X2K8_9GAMM|nr:type IV pilin protein [Kangiella aquimarina]WQG84739.1 type IV pilin protein [Kangiella aquimarina]
MIKFTKKTNGFTLMELMIVVAIIGIIAAIAIPSYSEYVKRAKRSDAMQALMGASEAMERYKAANFSYNGAVLADLFNVNVPNSGGSVYYTLSLENLSATTYRIRASDTGSMEGDGDLTINQAGVKTYNGAASWPD